MLNKTGLAAISEQTGADRATVSRVLRGLAKKYHIGDERAEMIQRVAEELGYRPNFYARAQSKGKFRTIGLLTRESATNWLPPQLFDGIQASLRERGLELHVCTIMKSDVEEARIPTVLTHAMVDGLLVLARPDFLGEATVRQIDAAPFPSVYVSSDTMSHGVYEANDAAAMEAVSYLRGLGHTRIELVAFNITHDEYRNRGYVKAMREAGIEPRIIALDEGPLREQVTARLAAPDRPTALICHSIELTPYVFAAAAGRGMRVPGDLSLMQMGTKSRYGEAVTGMYIDEYERGRAVVDMLLEKIGDPQHEPRPHIVSLERIEAGTCAKLAEQRGDAQRMMAAANG